MKFYDWPSPNYNDRPDGAKPDMIVIHYTSSRTGANALLHLSDPEKTVSAHFLIDEEGNVFHMVDEEKRAWHAGVSSWQGVSDVNSRSIGIEIQNRGNEPFGDRQLVSLLIICHDLMARYGIPPENVVGHSDVAPHRKKDPGAHFPWKILAKHGVGIDLYPTAKDKFNAVAKPRELKKLFQEAGYGVDAFGKGKPALRQLTLAFQRHFEPEAFKNKTAGKATEKTVAKLRALARRQKKLARKRKAP